MMNSPLVVEQARNVLRRVDVAKSSGTEGRIRLLYQLIYQRAPTDLELSLARDYVASDAATDWQTSAQTAWEYGYGAYDEMLHRARSFYRMGTFVNRTWQPGGKTPDPKLKGLSLTGDGGTPDRSFAVIRRWTAPRDGFISIQGTLNHPAGEGDGVQGWIVSSRQGELGHWTAYKSQAPAQLRGWP